MRFEYEPTEFETWISMLTIAIHRGEDERALEIARSIAYVYPGEAESLSEKFDVFYGKVMTGE